MIKEFRNDLLKRKEIQFLVEAPKNPGFAQVQNDCAHHFKVEADRVAVKKISSSFGSDKFMAEVFIYDTVADKEKGEPKPKPKKEAKK